MARSQGPGWHALAGILFGVYAWMVFGVLAGGCALVMLFLPQPARRRRCVRASARWLLRLTGIRLRVIGARYLTGTRPCLIAANHTSYLDAVALVAALPDDLAFVAKRELGAHFLVRRFLLAIGTRFVASRLEESGRGGTRQLIRAVRAGQSLVIFPEGRLDDIPGLGPFRRGAFVAAACAGAPVIPVGIRGARRALLSGSWILRPGPLVVQAGPPLRAAGTDAAAIARLLRQTYLAISELGEGPAEAS